MDWTPIIVAIISGVVSSFSAILVFIGNEKARKQKMEESNKAQLKSLEDSIKHTLDEHRAEYLDGIAKINNRMDSLEDSFSNLQATYQSTSALMELKITTLSDRVEKHNNLVERTYNLESKTDLLDEKIKVANNRILDLEKR